MRNTLLALDPQIRDGKVSHHSRTQRVALFVCTHMRRRDRRTVRYTSRVEPVWRLQRHPTLATRSGQDHRPGSVTTGVVVGGGLLVVGGGLLVVGGGGFVVGGGGVLVVGGGGGDVVGGDGGVVGCGEADAAPGGTGFAGAVGVLPARRVVAGGVRREFGGAAALGGFVVSVADGEVTTAPAGSVDDVGAEVAWLVDLTSGNLLPPGISNEKPHTKRTAVTTAPAMISRSAVDQVRCPAAACPDGGIGSTLCASSSTGTTPFAAVAYFLPPDGPDDLEMVEFRSSFIPR
jgi:hypothetical protein